MSPKKGTKKENPNPTVFGKEIFLCRNLLWQDAKVSLQTVKELGIKPSRPDLHPSVIIILTSSITCHPGSQYWRYILLPRTSLSLLFPLQPFCVSASDPGSFPFLCTAQSLFHYFITWSGVLPAPGSRQARPLHGLLIDRNLLQYIQPALDALWRTYWNTPLPVSPTIGEF